MNSFRATTTLFAATLALASAAFTPASAQETPKAKLKATHGSWEVRCVEENCTMGQVFKSAEGRPILAMEVQKLKEPKKLDKGEVVATARVITPLAVMLANGLAMRIDDGEAKGYPFFYCTPNGCEARPAFLQAELDTLMGGAKLELLVVQLAPDGLKRVAVPMSLEGFDAAYNDM